MGVVKNQLSTQLLRLNGSSVLRRSRTRSGLDKTDRTSAQRHNYAGENGHRQDVNSFLNGFVN